MIELKDLSRTYKIKNNSPVKALDGVNLKIGSTGMVFILGKSGSGKSTFLNVVGGLDKYDQGEIIIQGKSTKDFKQSDFDSYRNTMIGFIFQEYNVLDEFTVAQNIGLALELQGIKASSSRISEILESVDLAGYGSRKPNELSGGQKQRVAIARALVKDPKIIMADEPTGALDSETGKQVLDTLKKLSQKRLVIVVSHDRDFAEKYASRIVEFKDGQIITDISKYDSDIEIKETHQPLSFIEDAIHIEKGYQLTLEDLNVINQYLKTQKKAVTMTLDKPLKKSKKNSTTFIDTDHDLIEMSDEPYTPIKSKLPFKVGLKMGASALGHKKVRLVFSILLAAISFTLFGLSDVLGSYNKYDATIQSMRDSDINYLSLTSRTKEKRGDYYYHKDEQMNIKHIEALNQINPNVLFFPIIGEDPSYMSGGYSYSLNIGTQTNDNASVVYRPLAGGLMAISEQVVDAFGMSYLVEPAAPLADNQIVITNYMYEVFKRFGYRSNNTTVDITAPSDLIGKNVSILGRVYVIAGVVNSNIELNRFNVLDEPGEFNIQRWLLSSELEDLLRYSYHNVFFVNETTFASYETKMYMTEDYLTQVINGSENSLHVIYERSDLTPHVNYLKNIDASNIKDTDIFVNADIFHTLVLSYQVMDLNPLIVDYIIHEYTTLAEIREALIMYAYQGDESQVKPINEWDEQDTYDHVLTYYSMLGPYQKIQIEKSMLVLNANLFEPMDIDIKRTFYSDRGQLNEVSETFSVVGVWHSADYGYDFNQDIAISETTASTLNLKPRGYYSSAIASIDDVSNKDLRTFVNLHFDGEGEQYYIIRNQLMSTLDQVNMLIEGLAMVFFYVGIFFAIFASLLLLSFISASVVHKKQEIGILRAIGARGMDVMSIFTKEAIIIALINYVIAMIVVAVSTILLNGLFRNEYGLLITLLNLGIRQFLLVLIVSVGVAFLSAAIPVLGIARKRPIDAIRNK